MSQPYTAEQVRKQIYGHMRMLCSHFATSPEERQRMESLCFSVLNIFDGTAMELPAMDIILCPHEDDKEDAISDDRNWYEPGMVVNPVMMHEEFYK